MASEIFGLPLPSVNENDQVLSVLLVIKSFCEESGAGVAYQVCATDGLTTVEALGMAELAAIKLKDSLARDDE